MLAELGAVLPTRALYVLDGSYEDPAAYEPWLAASRNRIAASIAASRA